MAASVKQITAWFQRGLSEGATHMLVVCDTFRYEDYPVMVRPDQDARECYENYHSGGVQPCQRVMEVYNLSLPLGPQLAEERAFHF
jgi:hypothetical protein